MKKHSLFFAVAFGALTLFTGCSDDDVPAIEYSSQGSIKGTIKGTRQDDGIAIDESFSYSKYIALDGYPSTYEVSDNGTVYIYLNRGDLVAGSNVDLEFTLESATSTTPSYFDADVEFVKESDKIVIFYTSGSSNDDGEGSNTTTLSNFSFDKATGRVKGDISIVGDDNSTDATATVTLTFDVVVKQYVQ